MYVYVCICMLYMYVVYVCMYVSMYVYVCICMYMCNLPFEGSIRCSRVSLLDPIGILPASIAAYALTAIFAFHLTSYDHMH